MNLPMIQAALPHLNPILSNHDEVIDIEFIFFNHH